MDSFDLSDLDNVSLDGLEFCLHVYRIFESLRQTEEGRVKLRMRASDVEKKILEELLPICKFVQARYRPGRYISVRWIDGNQAFDAELEQHGDYVSKGHFPSRVFLEVTCAVHSNDYLCRELITKNGACFSPDGVKRLKTGEIASEPVVYTGIEYAQSFSDIVLDRISKKIKKNYPPGTILVIPCSPGNLCLQGDWDALVSSVKCRLPTHSFGEIFIYDTTLEHMTSL